MELTYEKQAEYIKKIIKELEAMSIDELKNRGYIETDNITTDAVYDITDTFADNDACHSFNVNTRIFSGRPLFEVTYTGYNN